MGMCNIPAIVNIKEEFYLSPLKCKQNDTLIFDFQVFDGSILADVNGWSCMLKADKNNGMGYQVEEAKVTASNSNIHIECESTLTQFAGTLLLELFFTKNGLQKTSFDIEIIVRKSVMGNSDGTVPECIITPLQKLDENLTKISESINNANAAKTALDNSKTEAEKTNNTLISNNTIATSTNSKLVTNTTEAKNTIQALKNANGEYTQHIKNKDIHLTEDEKEKVLTVINNWETILKAIDSLSGTSYLIDENGDYLVDENGDKMLI